MCTSENQWWITSPRSLTETTSLFQSCNKVVQRHRKHKDICFIPNYLPMRIKLQTGAINIKRTRAVNCHNTLLKIFSHRGNYYIKLIIPCQPWNSIRFLSSPFRTCLSVMIYIFIEERKIFKIMTLSSTNLLRCFNNGIYYKDSERNLLIGRRNCRSNYASFYSLSCFCFLLDY